ncbi:MAG: glycoside hydrolase N-terminal domain-containing protein [Mangrovibacterium sp.]
MNEESIWAGSKMNNNNPNALIHLKELQQALFNSEYGKAGKIAEDNFVGTPPEVRSYQPLENLLIKPWY